jgi:hypothetical protein
VSWLLVLLVLLPSSRRGDVIVPIVSDTLHRENRSAAGRSISGPTYSTSTFGTHLACQFFSVASQHQVASKTFPKKEKKTPGASVPSILELDPSEQHRENRGLKSVAGLLTLKSSNFVQCRVYRGVNQRLSQLPAHIFGTNNLPNTAH